MKTQQDSYARQFQKAIVGPTVKKLNICLSLGFLNLYARSSI